MFEKGSIRNVSLEQMKSFAELGYVVLPQVLPPPIIEFATRAIEDLKQENRLRLKGTTLIG